MSPIPMRDNMPTFVALLKISGRTKNAYDRLKAIPPTWEGVKTTSVVLGSGGYDAVVTFEAAQLDSAQDFINEYLRDNDPMTIIDTVIGETLETHTPTHNNMRATA
jgi:hypothetical protein